MTDHPRRTRVAVLGSTGSIGVNTLDVIAALPERLELVGLCAHSKWEQLAEQCQRFRPRVAVICDPAAARQADRGAFPPETELNTGSDAVVALVSRADVDAVVSAIVGAAGLTGTWAAIEAGKTIALANKETLVVAGPLVMALAAKTGSTIRPVDSEHSAIAQALTGHTASDVKRVVLTASGGPFRGWSSRDLLSVTPEQALQHPTWKMGPKISIDSATMMNKALEVIEARWLFGLASDQIQVIVHPESIVHSFVEFVDGSILAQLSPPDMRLPIQLALTCPDRVPGPAAKLDWTTLTALHFEQADPGTFPALALGFEAARRGGTCGAVLNAANEVAVDRFLNRQIAFTDIAACTRAVLDAHDFDPSPTLAGLQAGDRRARQEAARWTR